MSNQGFFNFVTFNSLIAFAALAAIVLWRKPSLWMPLFALFLGFVVGWFDMRSTEVSVTVLMLLTFGFFCGYARPRLAWLSALFLGLWVPIMAFVGNSLGLIHPTQTELITSFLALAFSLAGGLGGALVRRVAPSDSPIGS